MCACILNATKHCWEKEKKFWKKEEVQVILFFRSPDSLNVMSPYINLYIQRILIEIPGGFLKIETDKLILRFI